MFERLLLAAAAVAFAWTEPALTHVLRHIEPRQIVERVSTAVAERHSGENRVSRIGCDRRDARES